MAVALSVTFADRSGGLATIEFNADQFSGNIVLQPTSGQHFIAHTNHPRYSEPYIVETWFGGDVGKANRMLANSFWRQEYAENWLGASSNKDYKELQLLFRSYPVLFAAAGATDAELLGVIEQKIAELELTLKNNSPSPFPKVIKRSSGWGR